MTPLMLVFGIGLVIYLFVYNIVLMSIANAISDHLRKQGVSLKAEANLAGMNNSDFWNEVEFVGHPESDPVLAKFLKTKRMLVSVGVCIGVAFVVSLIAR